jgi:hypothetical protein
MNGTTGRCDPSISVLADETGLTKRGVIKAIAELERSGRWHVGRGEGTLGNGGCTNTYRPNFGVVTPRTPPQGEGGEQLFTTSPPKVVNNCSLPFDQGGEQTGIKVVNHSSPEPGRTRNEDSHISDRSATRPVCEGSPFDDFWRAYPSRTPHDNPKKPARTKFEAALRHGVDPADIIRGAANYAVYVNQHIADRQHVAMAMTWLGQERWNDHQHSPVEEPKRRRIGSW